MAVVGNHITFGKAVTLTAADEFTQWVSPGDVSGLVVMTLEFDSSWSATLRFDGGTKQEAASSGNKGGGALSFTADPITGTNLNGVGTAITTTGGASTTERWRFDVAALDGMRAYISAYSGGTVDITFNVAQG